MGARLDGTKPVQKVGEKPAKKVAPNKAVKPGKKPAKTASKTAQKKPRKAAPKAPTKTAKKTAKKSAKRTSKKAADRPTAKSVATMDRAAKALELRRDGATFADIGCSLGITASGAWRMVQTMLRELRETMAEMAEEVRQIELQRLDSMLFALRSKIRRADCKAIEVALRISDRRAKLLGLDAALKAELTGAGGGPIAIDEARLRLVQAFSRVAAPDEPANDPAGSDLTSECCSANSAV